LIDFYVVLCVYMYNVNKGLQGSLILEHGSKFKSNAHNNKGQTTRSVVIVQLMYK